jgi:HSP20 family protein
MFSLIPRSMAERKMARRLANPFELMRAPMGELFDRFFGAWPTPEWTEEEIDTGLEVLEKEKEILVRAAVPGLEPGELVVEVLGEVLTIRGEHKEKEEKKEEEKKAEVRPYFKMVRSILLPAGIDPTKVEASCKNGVLEVLLPRKPEAMPRRIEVKT